MRRSLPVGIALASSDVVAINLLIPKFEVPPSQLAKNLTAELHNTTGPSRSNPLTEPARRNPLTMPNPNQPERGPRMSLPASRLLQRLSPVGAIPIEPAAWPLDAQPAADRTHPKPDRPYIEHRIPTPPQVVSDAFNPSRPIADLENRMLDLFV